MITFHLCGKALTKTKYLQAKINESNASIRNSFIHFFFFFFVILITIIDSQYLILLNLYLKEELCIQHRDEICRQSDHQSTLLYIAQNQKNVIRSLKIRQ